MKQIFAASLIAVLLTVALFMTACAQQPTGIEPYQNDQGSGSTGPGLTGQTLSDLSGPKKFNSTQELLEYVKESQSNSGYGLTGYSRGGVMLDVVEEATVATDMMVKTTAAPQAAAGSDAANSVATDYSETNVQVEGVDEADIVKNDGKYIYMVNQDRLVIVDAYPAEDAEIIYEEKLDGTPRELFINGDRMAVFVEDYTEVYSIQPYDYMPRPRYVQETRVLIYDISDRNDPEVVSDYTLTGNYFQSRMIGDYVYFVVMDYVYYYQSYIDTPVIREGGSVVSRPEIYYFDNPEDSYVFHTVASFNINDDESVVNSKSFLMGYSNTLYVSQDNIYISYQKNMPWRYYDDDREEKFFKVVVPLLPKDVRDRINSVDSKDSYDKWMQISEIMQEMYENMDENAAEDLVDEIYDAIEEYEVKQEAERRKTIIHKISIDEGELDYKASGEVSGYLLNQFSLDENEGNLRVATTTYTYASRKSTMHNNVYVLDDGLDVIGKVEKIAPDEQIYSTRFIGDRLYMVTFKRIDPLFVIDLSNPRNPKILGELKIPGYSDYLHPYDEDHIIGIGKETGTNDWGGTSIKGVKVALFDVSDVKNPKLVDSYEIGTSGTDSEALSDHKAFLFDKEKNILVIPVREVKESRIYDRSYGYTDRIWHGAYVFGVTPEDGIKLKGKVSHMEGLEQYYYYYSGNAIRRALYMDDVLYTISGKKILMNDLGDIDDEINEISLPYDGERGWYY